MDGISHNMTFKPVYRASYTIILLFAFPIMPMYKESFTKLVAKVKNVISWKKEPEPICYLALLPKDATNLIANYLTFNDRETDEEFIARTQKLEHGIYSAHFKRTEIEHLNMIVELTNKPNKVYNLLSDFLLTVKNKYIDKEINHSCTAYPNEDFFIFNPSANNKRLITICHSAPVTTLLVFDVIRQALIKEEHFTYPNDDTYSSISHIAIAEKKNIFAFIKNSRKYSKLCMKDIDKPTVYKISLLPDFAEVNTIAFNKQETKVIVHGSCLTLNGPHDLHRLCDIEDEKLHVQKSKKTLEEYFRQKGVCKNWPHASIQPSLLRSYGGQAGLA